MNLFSPVSEIMSTRVLTVSPEDNLLGVKEIFDAHRFHHIPVVQAGHVVGMISRTDFAHFAGGLAHASDDSKQHKLERAHVRQIMTKSVAKLEPSDRINVAIEIFNQNFFHALPVVENGELMGIVTTFDIIRSLADDRPAHPEDVYSMALHEN